MDKLISNVFDVNKNKRLCQHKVLFSEYTLDEINEYCKNNHCTINLGSNDLKYSMSY